MGCVVLRIVWCLRALTGSHADDGAGAIVFRSLAHWPLGPPVFLHTRIGSHRGNPQSTIKYCTESIHTTRMRCLVLHCIAPLVKAVHSLEWHNSTITEIFPSTLRNALVVVCPSFYLFGCQMVVRLCPDFGEMNVQETLRM